MKKIISSLLVLLIGVSAYSAEYMSTHSTSNNIIRVQNVRKMYSNCKSSFMDPIFWAFDGLDGQHYTLYYTNDYMCKEDFDVFTQKVMKYDYNVCVQYGGGTACETRK